MSNRIELLGTYFGKLNHQVIFELDKREGASIVYVCKCGNCNNDKWELSARRIKFDIPISCGCLDNKSIGCTKHGFTQNGNKHPFYECWCDMKSRCNSKNKRYNSKDKSCRSYQDRNILVCSEWIDFNNFKNDMYESFQIHVSEYGLKNTTIDRIDSNKGYYLENCRWATCEMQSYNRDFTKHTMCIPILCTRLEDGYKIITYNAMSFSRRIFGTKSSHIGNICRKERGRVNEKGWTYEYITKELWEEYKVLGMDYINNFEDFKLSIPYHKIIIDGKEL